MGNKDFSSPSIRPKVQFLCTEDKTLSEFSYIVRGKDFDVKLYKEVLEFSFGYSLFFELYTNLDWTELKPGLFSSWLTSPTCTCVYKYGNYKISPNIIPPVLHPYINRIAQIIGVDPEYLNCVNANWYQNNTVGLGMHADNEGLFQGLNKPITIASLSLGASRDFVISVNSSGVEFKTLLEHGQLVTMNGLCQAKCLHGIPESGTDSRGRINLTFRNLCQHQASCKS